MRFGLVAVYYEHKVLSDVHHEEAHCCNILPVIGNKVFPSSIRSYLMVYMQT